MPQLCPNSWKQSTTAICNYGGESWLHISRRRGWWKDCSIFAMRLFRCRPSWPSGIVCCSSSEDSTTRHKMSWNKPYSNCNYSSSVCISLAARKRTANWRVIMIARSASIQKSVKTTSYFSATAANSAITSTVTAWWRLNSLSCTSVMDAYTWRNTIWSIRIIRGDQFAAFVTRGRNFRWSYLRKGIIMLRVCLCSMLWFRQISRLNSRRMQRIS